MFKNICFKLILIFKLIQSGNNDRKDRDVLRDVFRDDNWRRIQNLLKHLRWRFLQKYLTVFNH